MSMDWRHDYLRRKAEEYTTVWIYNLNPKISVGGVPVEDYNRRNQAAQPKESVSDEQYPHLSG